MIAAGRRHRPAASAAIRIIPAAGAIVLLAAGAAHATRSTVGTGVFPVAPPPAHTGGFGEPTCVACHMDHPLTSGGTALALRGLPKDGWKPGVSYALTVSVRSMGMQRSGFQLSARFADGAAKGEQAGSWRALDDRVAATAGSVTYAHHTEAGTMPASDSTSWTLEWVAPERAAPVVFHIAAIAADGDRSQFGDRVYAAEVAARPLR